MQSKYSVIIYFENLKIDQIPIGLNTKEKFYPKKIVVPQTEGFLTALWVVGPSIGKYYPATAHHNQDPQLYLVNLNLKFIYCKLYLVDFNLKFERQLEAHHNQDPQLYLVNLNSNLKIFSVTLAWPTTLLKTNFWLLFWLLWPQKITRIIIPATTNRNERTQLYHI